ncbi:nuclear transport factor 2 family protein [Nocardia sp. CA-120079]|uniref:nuclear transport factor 2 family protein n=1 Tax=Nocardia sp. CA-120079 TaxID=3239974 RepID=UPI003D96E6FE
MTATGITLQDNDIRQINELIIEHSWLLDHGRWHDAVELYTDDARMEIGGNVLEGRSALLTWADRRATDKGRRTHHQCTNVRLVPIAEGTVEGSVMLVLHVSIDGAPATVEFVGEYRDRYRRNPQGHWRFERRSVLSISDPT